MCATSLGFVGRFWATVALPFVAVVLTVLAFTGMEGLTAVRARVCSRGGTAGRAEDTSAASTATSTTKCNGSKDVTTPQLGAKVPSFPRALSSVHGLAASSSSPAQPNRRGAAAIRAFFASHQYLVALVIVLFLTYMPLVTLAIKALDCYDDFIGGTRYLAADLSVECFAGAHGAVVVGAGLVMAVVGLGFPAVLVATLRETTPRPSLRFLSDGYREGHRWWEALVLLRKAGLVMAASLVTDAPSQVAAAMLVLVPALWAQLQYRPYTSRRFNTLETLSLLAMILTATLSLVYLRAGSPDDDSADVASGLDAAVTLGLLGPNAAVVLLLVLAAAQSGALEQCESRCRGSRAGMQTSRPAVAAAGRHGTRPSMLPRSVGVGKSGDVTVVKSPLAGSVRKGASRRGFLPARVS